MRWMVDGSMSSFMFSRRIGWGSPQVCYSLRDNTALLRFEKGRFALR